MDVVAPAGVAKVCAAALQPAIGVTNNSWRGPTENRLGLTFYVDTNLIGSPKAAYQQLRHFYFDGWIELRRSDGVDTELGYSDEGPRRTELLEESADYPESLGPVVLDRSRPGHSVFGNDDDERRIGAVFKILFPRSNRSDSSTGRARHKIHDAMHVATAIRYGATSNGGFITEDHKDILRKRNELAAEFSGFQVMPPEEALEFVHRMRESYRRRTAE